MIYGPFRRQLTEALLGELGGNAYATLRPHLTHETPAMAGATLLAFFHNGQLIAVPHFGDGIASLSGPAAICNALALDSVPYGLNLGRARAFS